MRACHPCSDTTALLSANQHLLPIALVGNPNSGKSTIFNALTGLHADTAHYPGTTVEILAGKVPRSPRPVLLLDLPGLYTLVGEEEGQLLSRRILLQENLGAVIAVVDSTNLARNLYLVLQVRELGLPLVVALNMSDLLEDQGGTVERSALERLLEVPVVVTVATKGRGMEELLRAALSASANPQGPKVSLGGEIDREIALLADILEERPLPPGLSPLSAALWLLEEDPQVTSFFASQAGAEEVRSQVLEAQTRIRNHFGIPASLAISKARHQRAAEIAGKVLRPGGPRESRLWSAAISPRTGVPLLMGILAVMLAALFWGGNFLSTLLSAAWSVAASPVLRAVVHWIFGGGAVGRTLLWGIDAGLLAALSVGIPYVLTFYILLAFLEDTGFLSAMAFLADRGMRAFGLHGRAVIPLVAGAGCNVPAIIGTRVLPTMRERTIASTLITLVPCSARTAVILGAVALYLGVLPAFALYLIVLGLIIAVGWGLGRVMPGQASPLVMEVFPFRRPSVRVLWKKTWARLREFIVVALPLVMAGSVVLGGLYETGLIWRLSKPLAPVVEGWLGLPAVAGLTLVFAVLRKELALQLLVALALVRYGPGAESLLAFLNGRQIFVYALVNTLYIPCIATIAVLARELGWRRALLISAFTVTLAVAVGGIANRLILMWR